MGDLLVSSANFTWVDQGDGTFGLRTAEVVAHIVASRVSGPAPLAVQFDAIQSTSTETDDSWREMGYHFTFDDPNGGAVWSTTGLTKNAQIGGPLAAHVFEAAGTYTVKVRAQDSGGSFQDTSVEIVVTSADDSFPTTSTVVISKTSDTAGAPAGATLLINQTSWSGFNSDTRYLLKAGQDFTSFGTIGPRTSSDLHISQVGTGADPIVSRVQLQQGNPGDAPVWPERVAVYGLNITADCSSPNSATDILFYQNSIGETVSIGTTVVFYFNLAEPEDEALFFWPESIFVVDNIIDIDNSDLYGIFSSGSNGSAYMGNLITNPTQHGIRSSSAGNLFIAHDEIYGVGDLQAQMKLHSKGVDNWAEFLSGTTTPSAFHYQISNNLLGNGTDENSNMLSLAPAADGNNEGIEDSIVENCIFDNLSKANSMILGGRRLTERGNTDTSADGDGLVVATNAKMSGPLLDPDWLGPYFKDADQIIPDAPA